MVVNMTGMSSTSIISTTLSHAAVYFLGIVLMAASAQRDTKLPFRASRECYGWEIGRATDSS